MLPVIFLAVLLGLSAWLLTGGREDRRPVVLGESGTAEGSGTSLAGAGASPVPAAPDYGISGASADVLAEPGTAGAAERTTGEAGQMAGAAERAAEPGTAGTAGPYFVENSEEIPAKASEGAQEGVPEGISGESAGGDGGQVVLLFAGDVYLSDFVLNAYDAAGGISGVLDEGIRQEIAGADVFMVNQEFPFTDRGEQAADKEFTFRLPPARVNILKEMGVDVVTMANNHILDYGPEGITDSLSALDGAGIRHVGAGEDLRQAERPELVEIRGVTVGFLGCSRVYMDPSWAAGGSHPGVFSAYDTSPVEEAVRRLRPLCDYLVVYIHWGVEKATEPMDYQRAMGRRFLDAGADLVVGSHPHVLQEIEYYDGKPIVHSLGNFVFGSRIPETELVKAVIRNGQTEISTVPCRSSNGYTRLAREE